MSKRIVLCTDGTWDKQTNRTNVYRLFKAVAGGSDQVRFYEDGVGASGLPLDMLFGGVFGSGLFEKIKEGYAQIAHVYEAGDEIFLFGFSRGAYTARSIAGMIAACGLPTQHFDDALIETVFHAYRKKELRAPLLAELNGTYAMDNPPIRMVGVWDTVGSLGIPAVFGGVSETIYGFLDTSLNPKVGNGYHAVAIDERRSEFPPTLWTSPPAPGQTVEQVWFCGVHSDVGGGEPTDQTSGVALSDITLAWMMHNACALGLRLDEEVRKQYTLPLDAKYALDTVHSSWNPLWGFPRLRTIPDDACVADSVVVRCLHHDGWQPRNLKLVDGAPAPGYKVVSVVGRPMAAGAAG